MFHLVVALATMAINRGRDRDLYEFALFGNQGLTVSAKETMEEAGQCLEEHHFT